MPDWGAVADWLAKGTIGLLQIIGIIIVIGFAGYAWGKGRSKGIKSEFGKTGMNIVVNVRDHTVDNVKFGDGK